MFCTAGRGQLTCCQRASPSDPGALICVRSRPRLLEATDHVVSLDYDDAGNPGGWTILFGGERTTSIPVPGAPVPRSEPTWLLRIGRPVGDPMAGRDLLAALRANEV